MLHDECVAIVIDPGAPEPVLQALDRLGVALQAILVTHHHSDHTGAVPALRAASGAIVYGPARERIPEPFVPVQQDAQVDVPSLNLSLRVLDIPGHTAGHVAYYAEPVGQAPLLFCGDTLFSGGCGRLFEGTPAQMQVSLDSLAALPGDTLVCCAHEYTLSNLKFAQAVEPNNQQLAQYVEHCQALRAESQPTLPSRMALERDINPFLRTRVADVAQAAASFDDQVRIRDSASVLAALRQWKNVF